MKNTAIIYQPAKIATQSGEAGQHKQWTLERLTDAEDSYHDGLMGWSGSNDTNKQVRLRFSTLDGAVNYAKRNNIEYVIKENNEKAMKPKTYSENFTKPVL